jgi:hypothetical protein
MTIAALSDFVTSQAQEAGFEPAAGQAQLHPIRRATSSGLAVQVSSGRISRTAGSVGRTAHRPYTCSPENFGM